MADICQGDLNRIQVLEGDIGGLHDRLKDFLFLHLTRIISINAKVLRDRYISCNSFSSSQVLFSTARFTLEL